jgi:hypothetical protein
MKKYPPQSVRRESSQRGVIVMHLRDSALSDASTATFASQPLDEANVLAFLQNNFNNGADS